MSIGLADDDLVVAFGYDWKERDVVHVHVGAAHVSGCLKTEAASDRIPDDYQPAYPPFRLTEDDVRNVANAAVEFRGQRYGIGVEKIRVRIPAGKPTTTRGRAFGDGAAPDQVARSVFGSVPPLKLMSEGD